MGDLDLASPHEYVERELLPTLSRGRLVVLENMGHTDLARLQPRAFEYAAVSFFRAGTVDTSHYVAETLAFTPAERLGDVARRLLGGGK